MSDLLGNHELSLATDYIASQEISSDFNFALSYNYYGRRPTWQMAVFNWSQFYNSSRLYADSQGSLYRGVTRSQQRGILGNVSYPLDLYRRLDLSYTYVSENQDVVWPVAEAGGSVSTHLVKAAYVHDSITYGLLGPTAGKRYFLAAGRTLDWSTTTRSFSHLELDYREYKRLGRWSVLGLRTAAVGSIGPDALDYNLGGPAWFLPFYTGFNLNIGPLRGYSFSEFTGTRVLLLNTEVRVPFIRQVVFGWPGTFAIPAVDGSFFLDLGTAWNKGDHLNWWPLHVPGDGLEPLGEKDLRAGVGFGLLVYFVLPMNFEFAKQTDLRGNYSDYEFHFSFGKSF
jgi:outer membrane protein assembly factor BamA